MARFLKWEARECRTSGHCTAALLEPKPCHSRCGPMKRDCFLHRMKDVFPCLDDVLRALKDHLQGVQRRQRTAISFLHRSPDTLRALQEILHAF